MKSSTIGRWLLTLGLALSWTGAAAQGQEEGDEGQIEAGGRFKVLTGPDALENLDKVGKDRSRPPIESFRAQVAPFDILPFVKARHWSTISLEVRSNLADYEGRLQTAPVPMRSMPHEVVYRRDARLLKGQETRLAMQTMLPAIPRTLVLELARAEAIRVDEAMPANLRPLEPHQMLVMVLARNPNDYGSWTKLHAVLPTSGDRDAMALERQRYYRMVIPQDADKPFLSAHPLTWTTISHVIWDGLDPDTLGPMQQQAMLDWLHWGGQLIIVGGASPSLGPLRDSFLAPYLPADPAGENALLGADELAPLADAYRPSLSADEPGFGAEPYGVATEFGRRYAAPVPIRPASNRPVFFAGLRPREGVGAVELPLGDRADRLLGVERRVGRGRILMLSFTPTDPALVSWPGFDTLVRRVVLRRPEETLRGSGEPGPNPIGLATPGRVKAPGMAVGNYSSSWPFRCLPGPDLSWVRYVGRDLGAVPVPSPREAEVGEVALPRDPVADWNDAAAVPMMCRRALKAASGITIPGSPFILRVILAYIVALVPLNWLICRFILRRRELAWVVVPLLSLGFAIGVERAAAYDLGFDTGCDEIDLLETYADYPRGHLSRFAALFSTGRVRFTISYPEERTALALPMDTGDALRGEEVARSDWQSLPAPALVGLQVQPRSLALYRAEQMAPLPGTIELVGDGGARRIANGTGLELRDAVLVEDGGARQTDLGTIGPGADVALRPADRAGPTPAADGHWLDPEPFLKALRSYDWGRPEDQGEIRLVAWSPARLPGQKLDPVVDRHRGLTLVVAHLRVGPPPSPDGPRFDALASEEVEAERSRAVTRARPASGMGFGVVPPAGRRSMGDRAPGLSGSGGEAGRP